MTHDQCVTLTHANRPDANCTACFHFRWDGSTKFKQAMDTVFVSPDSKQDLGEVRTSGALTFVRIYGAGHMTALDQPEGSLLMVEKWLANKDFPYSLHSPAEAQKTLLTQYLHSKQKPNEM